MQPTVIIVITALTYMHAHIHTHMHTNLSHLRWRSWRALEVIRTAERTRGVVLFRVKPLRYCIYTDK